jgi:hypothetical protein
VGDGALAGEGALILLSLRALGISQIVLGLAHAEIWRRLEWSRESAKLSPLTGRVFGVHTFFVAFVLVLFGALTALHAELLLLPSPLARFMTGGMTLFWLLRLLAQPLVFDPVLLPGSPLRAPLRLAAVAYFGATTAAFGVAFAKQLLP